MNTGPHGNSITIGPVKAALVVQSAGPVARSIIDIAMLPFDGRRTALVRVSDGHAVQRTES